MIVLLTNLTDQLFRSFPEIFPLKAIFSVLWTPYQMVARLIDRMTCSFYRHADYIASLTAMA